MDSFTGQLSRETILRLTDSQTLTTWFQPLFSARTGEVYGYKALTRLAKIPPQASGTGQMLDHDQQDGLILPLDMHCRENAFRRATELGFSEQETYLYLNICPASLMYPNHKVGQTDPFAEWQGIDKGRVILEITEQEATRSYELFKRSINHYRDQGYKIAINDFGVGYYGGLKMLSVMQPDYVKVGRHLISGLDTDSFKYSLVDALATICHKLGIIVIAEGIERTQQLDIVLNFGIDLLQGFLLERPGPSLSEGRIDLSAQHHQSLLGRETELDICTIGAIAKQVEPLTPDLPLLAAHQRFLVDQALQGIPIVDHDRLVGMLCRKSFLEREMIGPYGYGFALSTHHAIKEALDHDFLVVEAATPIEEVVQKIQARRGLDLCDDVGVSKNGKYLGTVAIIDLLAAITQKNLHLAKDANPLSGLPGNTFIQRTLTLLIGEKVQFAACYIDIDNFKPYNDYYSFDKGDTVIKRLGELIVESVGGDRDQRLPFVGHIGGDDFIVVTMPHLAEKICQRIIDHFTNLLVHFHGPGDCDLGHYVAKDRQGVERNIPLLALSIGIVRTDDCSVNSYGELAFLVSEVKRAAKKQQGSAIVLNRRHTAHDMNTTQPRPGSPILP